MKFINSKIKLTFFFLFFIANLVFGQKITLLDKTNLEPIPNALIYCEGSSISNTTDVNGHADLKDFPKNSEIIISHVSFNTKILSFDELQEMKFTVLLSEKTNTLNEVVVSVNRFETSKRDLAQPIEIVSSKELAFQNAQTSGDALQNTGNVLVQKSQLGGGSPIIRGFETNKVLIAIDGVRMNNLIYRGGHIQNIITLDNTIMEKIEVLYGPSSVVYGSDALGGVMHFYTKKPILSTDEKTNLNVHAFTRYSSANDEKTAHIHFNIGGKKLALLTSITFANFGDLRQGDSRNPYYGNWGKRLFYVNRINGADQMIQNNNPNIQVGSAYSQYDVLQKFLFKQSEKLTHTVNFQYSNSSDINFYARLQQMNGNLPKFAEWYYGPQKRLFTSYTLNSQSNSKWYDDFQTILAYQNIEETRNDRRFNNNFLNHRKEKLNLFSFNTDFSKKIGKNDLKYGVEGVYNKVNSTAFSENILTGDKSAINTRYPDGGSTLWSFAGYISHILKLSEKFTFNDGIRFNYVQLNSKFNDKTFFPFPFDEVTQKNVALTGSIGIILSPNKGWRFSVMGSSGFRAPNVDDLSKVFESIPGSLVVPNPDLKPEHTFNIDLGISKNFNNVTFGISSYYTFYRNAITLKQGTFEGQSTIIYDGQISQILTNVNKNKAYIYGFNGFLNADITDVFSINSTLNYTFGRFITDNLPLDHVAPTFGKTSFMLNLNKFKSELFAQYNGWKRLKDYNIIGEDNIAEATLWGTPAWVTLNLKTAYQINDKFQFQIALENILDTNYRIFASGISAPGRNLIISLRGNI